MLAEVGIRMHPMNRLRADRWCTWAGHCPRCHRDIDTLFLEPGGTKFMTTCCGERGGFVALTRLLLVPAS